MVKPGLLGQYAERRSGRLVGARPACRVSSSVFPSARPRSGTRCARGSRRRSACAPAPGRPPAPAPRPGTSPSAARDGLAARCPRQRADLAPKTRGSAATSEPGPWWVPSAGLQNLRHSGGELGPPGGFGPQMLTTAAGQAVTFHLPILLRHAPFGLQPPAPLHPVQRRIEGALLDLGAHHRCALRANGQWQSHGVGPGSTPSAGARRRYRGGSRDYACAWGLSP